ncbi:type IIL restriction-modification enzyme MmeI [Streptomyces sp. NPDC087212]|uniref:type IIL restriction-modification enzyme MmeI n=1 Tax=Streptomyces sp. NPDC087212 TaxID=3365766 RepID=UPI00382FCAB4
MATSNRLVANQGRSFIGSYVLGKGFILSPQQAEDLIQRDPRNKDVLFAYLNGEDLNSRPDCSASRWVINFHDWSEERARSYPEVFAIVERDVKPERLKNNNRQRREIWWRFTRPAVDLYRAISNLDRVLVVALVSRTVMPARVSSQQVLSHKIGVFALEGADHLAFLSSSIHSSWAWRNSSTMKADLNYSPSDVYETLPWPESVIELTAAGQALETTRCLIMENRRIGLTKLYNLVHDATIAASDITSLRGLHEEIDRMVADAYGWGELDLNYGFHSTRQGVRYAIDPVVQIEILDRLLELNHGQHDLEAANGVFHRKNRNNPKGWNEISAGSPEIPTPVDDVLF